MAFAVYGVAVVVAPAIGPTLGGWITDNYNWRWIFFINIPVGILSLFMTYHLVHESAAAKQEHERSWRGGLRVDYIGFGLVALGFGCLQVVLDKGQEEDWFGSDFIVIFTIAGRRWHRRPWSSGSCRFATQPIVDVPLLGNRSLAQHERADVHHGVHPELHDGAAAAVRAADARIQRHAGRADPDARRVCADDDVPRRRGAVEQGAAEVHDGGRTADHGRGAVPPDRVQYAGLVQAPGAGAGATRRWGCRCSSSR